METRDSSGNNLNFPLLGMPAENDWVLYAPYSDKSLLRNVLTYEISNEMGRYASRTCFCEVVLNGDYLSIYVIMEKIKRDRKRINIQSLLPTYVSGDELTGRYIIKIDKQDGADIAGWYSAFLPYPGAWQQILYQYHYPDKNEIVSEQQSYIQDYIYQFEYLMNRSIYQDPFSGFYDFIDRETFIDHQIVNELGKMWMVTGLAHSW